MASAQVLPNSGISSKKKEHLQAGKKRLEEFRKRKAAEQAKKATFNSQLHPAGAGASQPEHARLADSGGAGTSDGVGREIIEPSSVVVVVNNDFKAPEVVHKTGLGSSVDTHFSPVYSANNHNIDTADPFQSRAKDEKDGSASPFVVNSSEIGNIHNFGISARTSERHADGIAREQITSFYSPSVQNRYSNSSKYRSFGFGETLSNHSESHLKDAANPGTSDVIVSNEFPETSGYSDLRAGGLAPSSYGDSVRRGSDVTEAYSKNGQNTDAILAYRNSLDPDMGERNSSGSVGHTNSSTSSSLWSTESSSMGFSFDMRTSSSQIPLSPAVSGINSRRSRPSFLDSINTSKVSSTPPTFTEPQKYDSFSSKVHPMDVPASNAYQDSMNSLASGNRIDLLRHESYEHNMERNHDFYSVKQNEDFAALEQHIEDLTQEKFSLQRALEASRALAESLASENSALTDSYNQQGSVVHQLKSDMENLQEEIRAYLVELESVKIEYANAQLECNAADERAKLLASEVIGLEEKALRLRSSELKLERQLENSQAEISSSRKRITSLEKDRQDLQFTIEALQEEKKLLQSKLRKASTSGKSVDISRSPNFSKKNVSTSTEDLDSVDRDDVDTTPDTSNYEMRPSSLLNETDVSSHPENRQYNLEGLSLGIPPDQLRMIQNINTLISELALEKEELVQALSVESSQSSKLKDLNKELSRKLELQTQRLELLTAQSIANDNIPARQPDSRTMRDNTPYADEGDEVVERVLGWIMKLFPGGPSKRRTSKLI